MSGHSEEVIAKGGGGGANPDLELLSKPFLPQALVCKIREILDRRTRFNGSEMPLRAHPAAAVSGPDVRWVH
jgi:hypothetical protein